MPFLTIPKISLLVTCYSDYNIYIIFKITYYYTKIFHSCRFKDRYDGFCCRFNSISCDSPSLRTKTSIPAEASSAVSLVTALPCSGTVELTAVNSQSSSSEESAQSELPSQTEVKGRHFSPQLNSSSLQTAFQNKTAKIISLKSL